LLEVELKAWADLDAARARLEALGKKPAKETPSVKEDLYFCGPETDPRTCDPRRDRIVRLRLEGDETVATAKRKSIERGVETNEEIEVTVAPAASFRSLLGYLGYRPFLQKRKESRVYVWAGSTHVELNRIAGLGDFVEVETLAPLATAGEDLERVRADLRAILATLGIDEARIEPRPYMDLLRERGVGLAS
jgi:predicted adenylyl cyclase CyaB